jgi:hypothetical protein
MHDLLHGLAQLNSSYECFTIQNLELAPVCIAASPYRKLQHSSIYCLLYSELPKIATSRSYKLYRLQVLRYKGQLEC